MRIKIKKYWTTIKAVFKHLKDGDIVVTVNSLSFVTLLSLAPLLIVILALFKYTGFLAILYPKVEILLLKKMTGVTGVEVSKYLQSLVKRSYTGSFGLLTISFLVVTINRLAFDLEHAINRLWHLKNPRNVLKRLVRNWAILFLLPIAIGLNIGTRWAVYEFVTKQKEVLSLLSVTFLVLTLWAIFYWLPNTQVRKGLSFVCAFISALFLLIVQNSFGEISNEFFKFNKFYGSLASLPLFLFWLSAIWFVILFGVGVNASLQKGSTPQIESKNG